VPERVLVSTPFGAPLFILAPPRSFTTVVCAMIGQHPEMYGLPEVNLFTGDTYGDLAERVHRVRPGFGHGLLRAVAQLGFGAQTVETVEDAREWLEENAEATTAELFAELATAAAPRRLVDKSPLYTYRADALERIAKGVPNAYYLHLTRHPRGTCESVFRMRADIDNMGRRKASRGNTRGSRNRTLTPESMWLEPQKRILQFLKGIPPERQMRVRGEDLMADPDRYLGPVCEWLGISTAPEALEAMKHPEGSPFASFGPRNALFGNDPNFSRDPKLRPYTPKHLSLEGPIEGGDGAVLNEAIKDCARQLGYAD
jgi:hypothetical protein